MTLSNLLTLRVDFRDEQAAARITPEQANAYLAARGWTLAIVDGAFHLWTLDEKQAQTCGGQPVRRFGPIDAQPTCSWCGKPWPCSKGRVLTPCPEWAALG